MKVALFCGGFGMRMRDGASDLPKPMQMVGDRPLLWHVMRTYAHFGHTDFILCLGYGAQHVVDYFRSDEGRSGEAAPRTGGDRIEVQPPDGPGWTITFVHTGLETPIGERLRRVREHLAGESVFAANYADVLTDAPLDVMEREFRSSGAVGMLLAVPPQASFHLVEADDDCSVRAIYPASSLDVLENGGYYFFTPAIFDHLHEGEDLVDDALTRLAATGLLRAYPHRGFWTSVDTVKERSSVDAMARRNHRPWAVWAEAGPGSSPSTGGPGSRAQEG